MGALPLGEMPALPLHTAGKYVAAAYIVLFVLVLIYVAIMAIRLSRIERELGELLELSERSDRSEPAERDRRLETDARMSELLALGISHKTAPVALRERLAFTEPGAVGLAQRMIATAEVREAVVLCTCNRTELYLVVGDPVRREDDALGMLARHASSAPPSWRRRSTRRATATPPATSTG